MGERLSFWDDTEHINALVTQVCRELIRRNIDITDGYDNWVKVAWALQGHSEGERLFHELSALNKDYNAGVAAQKWRNVGQSHTVTANYLLHQARQYIGEQTYRDLKRKVYEYYR